MTAIVDYNGVRTTARLDALSEEVAPGDYVLIHTGFAIRRLSAQDGEETLRLFDELSRSIGVDSSVGDDAGETGPTSPDNPSDAT